MPALDFLNWNVYFILLKLESFIMFSQTPVSYNIWFAKQIWLGVFFFVLEKKSINYLCVFNVEESKRISLPSKGWQVTT